MATTTGRGPYAKSAEVRRKILQACVDAFGGAGFHGSSTKDIAQRAGISHTGLRHHFPTKEDLLIALLELRAEDSAETLAAMGGRTPERDPLASLRGQLAILRRNQASPGMIELHCVLSGEATSPDHPAHAYYIQRYQDLRHFYTTAFTTLAERGAISPAFAASDPQRLGMMTISLINGLQAQWLYDRETVDIEGTVREFLVSVVPELDS